MDLSQGYDIARFYRNGATRFTLALVGRSETVGLTRSEGWVPASGAFATPKETYATETVFPYRDRYDDVYRGEARQTSTSYDPMDTAAPIWQANTGATDTALTTLIDAALTAGGYTRPDGTAIT